MDGKGEGAGRVPPAFDGIQVNFCKNPTCGNFSVPADERSQKTGRGARAERKDRYIRSGDKSGRFLLCNNCGESAPIKNNQGIAEGLERMCRYLAPPIDYSCPNVTCINHTAPIGRYRNQYKSYGTTKAGSRRFRCLAAGCGKTFSIPVEAQLRHRLPEKGTEVFRALVCKVPIRKISYLTRTTLPTVYGKLQFIREQCLRFAGEHERSLAGRAFRRLYIAIDRQDHLVNWTSAKDRRTVTLQAVASADCRTGFVFGVHINYDPSLDLESVERDSLALGDYDRDPANRRHARVWLWHEHQAAIGPVRKKARKAKLEEQVSQAYSEAQRRVDVEASDSPEADTRLPGKGVLIHAEYTLYGHLYFLRQQLASTEKLRFYCDQESGLRAAVMAVFSDWILEKRCDAFYVRIAKELTNPQKLALYNRSIADLQEFRAKSRAYDEVGDHDLRVIKATADLKEMKELGRWRDRWLISPFPDMSEPEKAVCYLTNIKKVGFDYEDEHLARLHLKASLHAVDRFFAQVRRNLSQLERPIASASSTRRGWYGYSPYNPAQVGLLLDIFRVWYNYVETGKDGKTPAMRLGLADRVYTEDEVLRHWSPTGARVPAIRGARKPAR